jgi:putative endonuclease
MDYFVYILAGKPHGTLYVGMTADLESRMRAHKAGEIPGFTKEHEVKRLVHYEAAEGLDAARARERQLKRWRRDWKINLIERENPHWHDLAAHLNK